MLEVDLEVTNASVVEKKIGPVSDPTDSLRFTVHPI